MPSSAHLPIVMGSSSHPNKGSYKCIARSLAREGYTRSTEQVALKVKLKVQEKGHRQSQQWKRGHRRLEAKGHHHRVLGLRDKGRRLLNSYMQWMKKSRALNLLWLKEGSVN
ncbi:hypothetical protein JD844_032001 [Phrynosoma platyrhinos]|uniref:Uncharacterized protein n=1 Tax=Phrynosoma platyrhinos TaxID=52577 RepID=A0ABQ7T4M0_PHRPL|nr:hypothetical protein JD844_032001 [Phrynosoma platyrhinos]